jgi:hypothetical protein
MDQPSSSKGHDNRRKVDRSVNMVEWQWHHKEFRPRPGFTPRESTRPRVVTDSKVSQMRFSRRPKGPIKRKSLRIPRATSPRLIKRSTTSMVAPSHMSRGGSENSLPGSSWLSRPPPPSTLSGQRSSLPSTVATTRILCQSWGGILS